MIHKCMFQLFIILIITVSAVELTGNQKGVIEAGEYSIKTEITIKANDTLKINPGTILKFSKDSRITVHGVLLCLAHTDNRIVFTSAAKSPKEFDWAGIFGTKTAKLIVLTNTEIKYSSVGVNLINKKTSVQFRNVSFFKNGISNLRIEQNVIDLLPNRNDRYYYVNHDTHDIQRSISYLKKKYIDITGTFSGPLDPKTYFINGVLTVPENKTLELSKGTKIILTPKSAIHVYGTISAMSVKSDPIQFTSYRDGTPSVISGFGPFPGDYKGIILFGEKATLDFDCVEINYSTLFVYEKNKDKNKIHFSNFSSTGNKILTNSEKMLLADQK